MAADTVVHQGVQELETSESEDDSGSLVTSLAISVGLAGAGVAGRAGLQHIPSVEPLIAVAAATGFYFGTKRGVLVGASAFYASNFLVYGGQGPWTVFQVFGAAAAGMLGGLFGDLSESRLSFFGSAALGVIAYEVIVNLGSLSFASFSGLGVAYLLSAVPFGLTHLASTIGFGLILYGSKEKIGLYRND
jgi:hypothetical protein